jgi:N-acetylglucosamine-6-phosphate deacetylase
MEAVEAPGLFDLQVNGFAGVDFNDPSTPPQAVLGAIEALRRTGVTRFLPTIITSSRAHFAACARALLAVPHPAIVGLHMEGPYLAPAARGAHPAEHLVPASVEDFERRQEAAGGLIRLVTLAPEVPGALALIAHLVARGVRVALGHTGASPALVREAMAAGASLSTHLGNGGTPEVPRHPNFIWEQLAADELSAGFIVDGHHLAPSVVKAMVRAKGLARTLLVTDAVAAAGCPPGPYRLGAVEVERTADGRVVLAGGSRLAGSALTLDAAVGNLVRFAGVALADALACASGRPAAALGLAPAGRLRGRWDAAAGVLHIDDVSGGD